MRYVILTFLLTLIATNGSSQDIMIGNLSNKTYSKWIFIADTVMGGVSTGKISFIEEKSGKILRLSGEVSTANNGGFIQARTQINKKPAINSEGVRLIAKGNGEKYYIHLRTTGTFLPWQYFQSEFPSTNNWTEIILPFKNFTRSARGMRKKINPRNITTVGIVAYGKDYNADLYVSEINFY